MNHLNVYLHEPSLPSYDKEEIVSSSLCENNDHSPPCAKASEEMERLFALICKEDPIPSSQAHLKEITNLALAVAKKTFNDLNSFFFCILVSLAAAKEPLIRSIANELGDRAIFRKRVSSLPFPALVYKILRSSEQNKKISHTIFQRALEIASSDGLPNSILYHEFAQQKLREGNIDAASDYILNAIDGNYIQNSPLAYSYYDTLEKIQIAAQLQEERRKEGANQLMLLKRGRETKEPPLANSHKRRKRVEQPK